MSNNQIQISILNNAVPLKEVQCEKFVLITVTDGKPILHHSTSVQETVYLLEAMKLPLIFK